jgi:hypothetical protein
LAIDTGSSPTLKAATARDVQLDALVGDAVLDDLSFPQRQRQRAGPLLDRHDEAAVAGADPELRVLVPALGTRYQQSLIGVGDMPEEHRTS